MSRIVVRDTDFESLRRTIDHVFEEFSVDLKGKTVLLKPNFGAAVGPEKSALSSRGTGCHWIMPAASGGPTWQGEGQAGSYSWRGSAPVSARTRASQASMTRASSALT